MIVTNLIWDQFQRQIKARIYWTNTVAEISIKKERFRLDLKK